MKGQGRIHSPRLEKVWLREGHNPTLKDKLSRITFNLIKKKLMLNEVIGTKLQNERFSIKGNCIGWKAGGYSEQGS